MNRERLRGGTVGADSNVVNIWDDYLGSGVVIAVVDDGVQHSHPDLLTNYLPSLSYDFNFNDPDPTPDQSGDNHGTSVAGVALATGNNSTGVSGAAPDASLAAIRLIAAGTTDWVEANGLSFEQDEIDIYSNSWGPSDDGMIDAVGQAGPLAIAAIRQGVTTGRGGLGNIYTWAAGNGLQNNDNANYDLFANSRYTIAVSAIDHSGRQSYYSEPGAPILVASYSNGSLSGITTTDRTGEDGYNSTGTGDGDPAADIDYTSTFGGTSSATPLVAGVIALMLEANPNLTWRDVQHILVNTATQNDSADSDWLTNGAGHLVNHKYGFGAIDAHAAVLAALAHSTVGSEYAWTSGVETVNQALPDNDPTGVSSVITVSADMALEWVEVEFNATHTFRGDLEVVLTSPDGTESILAESRLQDSGANYSNWSFTSARHWDESPVGDWVLTVRDQFSQDTGTFDDWTLKLYGTLAAPTDDHGNIASTSTSIAVPSATIGNLENDSDVDWFQFSAVSGAEYTIETSLGTLLDSTLTLFDTNGTSQLSFDDNGGTGLASRIVWTAPASGIYFIQVDNLTIETGTYALDIGVDFHGEIHGQAWNDLNGDGVKGGNEPTLPNWTVYLDQNNNGVLDAGGAIEPDNHSSGTVLNSIIPEVTLSAVGMDAASPSVHALPSSSTSTGSMGFASNGTAIWTDITRRLKMDFSQLVSQVSIDFISDDGFDIGRLQVFDSQGNILAEYITGGLESGMAETMRLTRQTPDIAYAIAGGFDGEYGRLDNLSFGETEVSTVTNSNGEYSFTGLLPGNYVVRQIGQPTWRQTSPTTPPSSVLITEVSLGLLDWLEIQNVSDAAVDTNGWQVVVSDSPYSDINSVNSMTWSLPASMSSGEVQYKTDSAADNPWGSNIFWNVGPGTFTGWAMILDSSDQIVDWVGWGWTDSQIASFDVTIGTANISDLSGIWSGSAISNVDSTGTGTASIQRISSNDSNSALNFVWAASSKGLPNSGLSTPHEAESDAQFSNQSNAKLYCVSDIMDWEATESGYADSLIGGQSFSYTEVIASIAGFNPLGLLSNFAESVVTGLEDLISIATSKELFSSDGSTVTVIGLQPGTKPLAAIEVLRSLPFVDWVAPNYIYETFDPRELIPNDTDFGQQYFHSLMRNDDAWDITLGSSDVIIGIADDGVDTDHVDLALNIWTNSGEIPGNLIDDDANGFIDDVNGWDFVDNDNDPNPKGTDDHGTHVAGIAAGRTNNATGIAGTAGGATIMPLKFYDSANSGAWTSSVIAATYAYAIDNGATILNTSYNVNGFVGDPTFTAGLQYFYDQGGLHLISAGNSTQLNPARQVFDQSIFVSSTTSTDSLSSFSNYGFGIDVAAPGSSIYATLPNDLYGTKSGTSMSTPNAAGVAALIWSHQPTWTRDQVAAQLIGTADNIDALNPGFERLLGAGRVNAYRGLTDTLAPPTIERVHGVPSNNGTTSTSISSLSVDVGNVFDPSAANNGNHWTLIADGNDDIFDSSDDVVITLTPLTNYMVGTNRITFSTGGILAPDRYRFTGISGGLVDPFGTPLDGNNDGIAGDNFVHTFSVVPATSDAAYFVTLTAGQVVHDKDFGNQSSDSDAPVVALAIVSGMGWNSTIIDGVDGGGVGNGNGLGIELSPGLHISNSGINRVYLQFSEDIGALAADQVELLGSTGSYSIGAINYSPSTFLAEVPIIGTIGFDKLRLAISDSVTDSAGNALDGDSNGSAGGIFDLRFDVAIGDINGDGQVFTTDLLAWQLAFNSLPGSPNYNPDADLNGDGQIFTTDLLVWQINFNKNLSNLAEPIASSFRPPLESSPSQKFFVQAIDRLLTDEDESGFPNKSNGHAFVGNTQRNVFHNR